MEEKQFSYLQLLNLVDGRLFTSVADIQHILGHIYATEPTTLGMAMLYDSLKKDNPKWFDDLTKFYKSQLDVYRVAKGDFNAIKALAESTNFMVIVPKRVRS